MNYRTVFRVWGLLLLVLAGIMVVPLLIALYNSEDSQETFLAAIVASFTVGILLASTPKEEFQFHIRESFLMVTGGWTLFAMFGALPYCLGSFSWFTGPDLSFTDAFFETMSGLTTTGATILIDIEAMPKSILFWRALTHWMGGMGIIVLSLAIMPLLGAKGANLFKAEVPGISADKLMPRLQGTAKVLWTVYALLTLIHMAMLYWAGMSFFDSVCHAFSTMATGGFSNNNQSIAGYHSPLIEWIMTLFMVIAGANFALHYHLLKGNVSVYRKDTEFKFYFGIFLVASLVSAFALTFQSDVPFEDSIRQSAFQVASILTTTGYVSENYVLWPHIAQFMLFGMMLIGGSGGSTGGGIKVIRILMIVKLALSEIKKTLHPKGVFNTKLAGAPIKEELAFKVLSFVLLYIGATIFFAGIISITGVDLGTSLSASLSSIGNIGPGFGGVGPTESFSGFPDVAKWFLSAEMLLGRLELFTILVFFTRDFWKS